MKRKSRNKIELIIEDIKRDGKMKSLQITARSVQKAIDNALQQLGLNQDDVDIKILDEGGLFRKAKVEIFYEEKNNQEDLSINSKIQVQEEDKIQQNKIIEVCTGFLQKLFSLMGIEAKINYEERDSNYYFEIDGDNVSRIIGRRGETLNAIQELLKNIVRNAGFKEKVFFNVCDYKNKRENALISLAERTARKAIKIGKPIKLESMSAYERRIIHVALQDYEGVTTQSEGKEPHRYLVVIPIKK